MAGDIEGVKRVRDTLDFVLKPALEGFVEANMKGRHGNPATQTKLKEAYEAQRRSGGQPATASATPAVAPHQNLSR